MELVLFWLSVPSLAISLTCHWTLWRQQDLTELRVTRAGQFPSLVDCELGTKQLSGEVSERLLQKQWFCCHYRSHFMPHIPPATRVLSLESMERILGVHEFGEENCYLIFINLAWNSVCCSIWIRQQGTVVLASMCALVISRNHSCFHIMLQMWSRLKKHSLKVR